MAALASADPPHDQKPLGWGKAPYFSGNATMWSFSAARLRRRSDTALLGIKDWQVFIHCEANIRIRPCRDGKSLINSPCHERINREGRYDATCEVGCRF